QVEPDIRLIAAHRQLIPARTRGAARRAVQHRHRYLTERLTGLRWQSQQSGFELLLEMTQGTFGSLEALVQLAGVMCHALLQRGVGYPSQVDQGDRKSVE